MERKRHFWGMIYVFYLDVYANIRWLTAWKGAISFNFHIFFYIGSLEECFKYRSLHLRCLRISPEDLCILLKKSHFWEPKNIFMWFLQNNFKRNWLIGHAHVIILMDLGTWSDIIMYLRSTLWIYISTHRITSGQMLDWIHICCLYGHCIEAVVLGEFSEPRQKSSHCCMRVGLATFKLTITF